MSNPDDEPHLTIKLSAYDKLREDARTMQTANYELEKQLKEARLADPSGLTQQLNVAFHEAIKVVQFAVANLPPESVAGWPHEALAQVADAIAKTPTMDAHVMEVVPELRAFAKTAAGYETYRKERAATRVVVAASASDYGPKTTEAALVHALRAQQLTGGALPGQPTVPAVVDEQEHPNEQAVERRRRR
jgi:hypothetical protein